MSYKGPNDKYFWLCLPYAFGYNCSTCGVETALRQYVNRQVCLCSHKTLFSKTDSLLNFDLKNGSIVWAKAR